MIYLFYCWFDLLVYLMGETMRQISVLGLRRVVCNGFLVEVFWFLGGDDLCLCLLCSLLQFLVLYFELSVVFACLFQRLMGTRQCWHIQV